MGWRRGWAGGWRRGIEVNRKTNEGPSLHATPSITSCMQPSRRVNASSHPISEVSSESLCSTKELLRAPTTFPLLPTHGRLMQSHAAGVAERLPVLHMVIISRKWERTA